MSEKKNWSKKLDKLEIDTSIILPKRPEPKHIQNTNLIEQVKIRPSIWCKLQKHPKKIRHMRLMQWQQLIKVLGIESVEEAKRRWEILRDIFRREYKKGKCPNNEYRSTWYHFRQMLFLRENNETDNETCSEENQQYQQIKNEELSKYSNNDNSHDVKREILYLQDNSQPNIDDDDDEELIDDEDVPNSYYYSNSYVEQNQKPSQMKGENFHYTNENMHDNNSYDDVDDDEENGDDNRQQLDYEINSKKFVKTKIENSSNAKRTSQAEGKRIQQNPTTSNIKRKYTSTPNTSSGEKQRQKLVTSKKSRYSSGSNNSNEQSYYSSLVEGSSYFSDKSGQNPVQVDECVIDEDNNIHKELIEASDYHFAMSLVPFMKTVTESNKLRMRMRLVQVLLEENLRDDEI